MQRRRRAALGGAVEPLEITAQGAEGLHHLGSESGRGGDGGPNAPEAELIAQWLEHKPPANPARQAEARRHRLAFEFEPGIMHAARKEELPQRALQPVGVLDAHLGLGQDVLPDPWWCER